MPLKTDDRDIGGLKVTTTQLPPMRALNLLTRLGKVFGPMLAQLPDLQAGKLSNEDIAMALGVALGKLEDGDVSKLTRDILITTRVQVEVNGQPRILELTDEQRINSAFEGKLEVLLQAMVFSLEVNFAAFFQGLLPAGASKAAVEEKGQP